MDTVTVFPDFRCRLTQWSAFLGRVTLVPYYHLCDEALRTIIELQRV